MNESPYPARQLEPFTGKSIADIAERYGTPVWIYDAEGIRTQIERLRRFDVIRFAQKASSNTHILRLMMEQGVLVDAVSLGEIERALIARATGERFTGSQGLDQGEPGIRPRSQPQNQHRW